MIWAIVIVLIVVYLVLDRAVRLIKVGGYNSKYVFITGCDSGFGRDLAIRLDKMGFPVFAACLTEDGRRSLTETCSSRVETLILNVADNNSIREALQFVKQKLPQENSLWAVVNNAGVTGRISVVEMCHPEDYMQCSAINLFGPIEISRVFMPLLRKSRGRLVLMTSILGRCPALTSPYCVSKSGLEAFGDVCRREVSNFGVKVSIIEPGFFKTNIMSIAKNASDVEKSYKASSLDVQAAYGKDYVTRMQIQLNNMNDNLQPDTHKVVDAYISAITSVYPRPRYVLGTDAKLFFLPISYMPECVGDWILVKKHKQLKEASK